MIIDDLNLESIPCAPREANSPLVVDPDGVLSRSIAFQLLQLVAWYAAKLIKSSSGMDCDELLQGTLLNVTGNARCSTPAHLRQEDELPGARHRADRHFDQGRAGAAGEAAPQRAAQLFGQAHALGGRAEALGKAHEVRIGQIARDQPVAVALLL